MTRAEIIAKLKESAPAIKAEGVTKLAIFGRARAATSVPTAISTC